MRVAVSHLGKRKTVLVCLLVLELKVVESFALRWRLRQWLDHLDEVGGEKAVDATHLPVVPVLVHLATQDDDVPFAELEVSWFLAIVVVEGLGTGELWYTLKSHVEDEQHEKETQHDPEVGPHHDGPTFMFQRCSQT